MKDMIATFIARRVAGRRVRDLGIVDVTERREERERDTYNHGHMQRQLHRRHHSGGERPAHRRHGGVRSAQIAAGQTTSTLTLSPGANAALGTTTLTVTASASAYTNHTVSVQLTVTSPPLAGPFSLSLSVTSFLALPPEILPSPPVLTITRNAGLTGAVALTVEGLPLGLIVAVTPNNTTASVAQVVIINGGAANGTYTVTIRGTASGGLGEQTVTFQVVVASPTTGAIRWQFCTGTPRAPQWFLAVKDGSGPWTRPVPSANAQGIQFSFNVTQPTVMVALVTPDSGGFRTTYYHYTQQEPAAVAAAECTLFPGVSTRTVGGNVANVAAGEISVIGMGWWFGSTSGNGGYTLLNLPAGPGIDRPNAVRTVYGVPLAQTMAGDLHQVIATIATVAPVRATKQIMAYNRTIADRSLDFGPALAAPTVSVVAGAPAGRLRLQGTLQADYNSGVTLDVTQGATARFATIHATRGFLGAGSSYDVQMPDMSTAVGWDTNFALRAGSSTVWIVSGGGPTLNVFDGRYIFNSTRVRWAGVLTGVTAPADGAVYKFARVYGNITP